VKMICKAARLLFPGQLCLLLCACACEFGMGVRVSEIKATNLVNIIGGFLKKKWLGLGVIRTIVC
jgi:hypothetical protein